MPRRGSSSGKKSLYPLAGAGFIGLLILSFVLGRATVHAPAKAHSARRPAAVERKRAVAPIPAPLPRPAVPAPAPSSSIVFPQGKGKIAIVLDDWGYTMKQVPILTSIRRPLTVSVLPSLPHSSEVAKIARANGNEVILHMPMEAVDPDAPREKAGTLLTGMSRKEVVDLLSRSLATVPSARGINNHQGSKATADPVLMETVLKEVKRRGLYFLDSYVSKTSICEEVAAQVKIPFAQRAVFLDNEQSEPEIQHQLEELAASASKHGQAIGIGHDRPVTLAVLQKAVPALEKAGYTLVPVSQLTEVPDTRSGN